MAKMVICPFCNEDDFDLIGLKAHLLRGHCDPFEATISPEEERFDTPRIKAMHVSSDGGQSRG